MPHQRNVEFCKTPIFFATIIKENFLFAPCSKDMKVILNKMRGKFHDFLLFKFVEERKLQYFKNVWWLVS